jgi:hypothetical protein
MFTSTVRAAITPWDKECQLMAVAPITEGDVILAEAPLVSVPNFNLKYSTTSWDLVDKILSNGNMMQRYLTLSLKESVQNIDAEDRKFERDLAKRHRVTRDMVRRIYFGVCTNNIGYKNANSELIGYGIYPIVSRANHSCRPNAAYCPGNLETKEITLVARRDIQVGEAVTWNYAGTSAFLDADYSTRNLTLLDNFRFVCRCERCQEEIPPELALLPNLIQYFDVLLMDEARQQAMAMMGQENRKEN